MFGVCWIRSSSDSPLEEAGFEPSVPRDTTKFSMPAHVTYAWFPARGKVGANEYRHHEDAGRLHLVARIGRLAARSGGYRRAGPLPTPDSHRAIQSEPRSPSSHPEAAAQSDELGGL